jgi:hypothetical protein
LRNPSGEISGGYMTTDPNSLPAPTSDEKSMALLAHVLEIFTWWIGLAMRIVDVQKAA